ncbi:reverse transcriptase domain-containing protein [Tanacetum coccineum]
MKGFHKNSRRIENEPFADFVGSVTLFVRWIEDYPLPDGPKMPSHIGSYDGKGDPDNFLHLFKGAIRMQKWLMPVACHMFTYTLKDSARIWWNSQKTGSILNYEDLKAKFWSHFSQQKKFTKTHLAVHNIKQRKGESTRAFITRYTDDTLQILGLHEEQLISAREVATNGTLNNRRDSFERSKKSSWDNNRGRKNKDRFSPYRGPNHGLLPSLSKSPKEILATEKAARSFEPPPKMFGSKRSRDMSKYCHFHEDYGHDTNDCRYLRTQIQEAVNSGQLLHLVKGIKKEGTKLSNTSQGESRKDKGKAPAKIPILMVGRVCMDGGSSCEIIYESFFEKLNPTIKATKVDLETPLVGFSGERIPRTIMVEGKPFNMEHKMNKYSHIKPIKQNKRGLGPDHNMAACKEIEELTKARILWKAKRQTWVANPVMVKKSDGGWRICVNFTDINKAYPKD